MAVMHQHLPLEQVRPGMVLSDVLLDAHGQVLLPQGAVLTENMLSLMPRHGIDMLPIQAPPPFAGGSGRAAGGRQRAAGLSVPQA